MCRGLGKEMKSYERFGFNVSIRSYSPSELGNCLVLCGSPYLCHIGKLGSHEDSCGHRTLETWAPCSEIRLAAQFGGTPIIAGFPRAL